MKTENRIEVINREGWRNEFPIEKKILYIGTDARNDIVLGNPYGTGIHSRHLQVISGLGNAGYRLVNLGHSEIPLSSVDESSVLAPLAFANIENNAEVQLGDFRLIFHGGHGGVGTTQGNHQANGMNGMNSMNGLMDLRLLLPRTKLEVNEPIMAQLLVRHLGEEPGPGVQFELEAEGLPAECYELGAAPFLFPYGEEEVPLKLMHSRQPEPKGGDYRLTIRATAPDFYPGVSATVSETIWIAPFFDFSLTLQPKR